MLLLAWLTNGPLSSIVRLIASPRLVSRPDLTMEAYSHTNTHTYLLTLGTNRLLVASRPRVSANLSHHLLFMIVGVIAYDNQPPLHLSKKRVNERMLIKIENTNGHVSGLQAASVWFGGANPIRLTSCCFAWVPGRASHFDGLSCFGCCCHRGLDKQVGD